jgi:hypothetical protein
MNVVYTVKWGLGTTNGWLHPLIGLYLSGKLRRKNIDFLDDGRCGEEL